MKNNMKTKRRQLLSTVTALLLAFICVPPSSVKAQCSQWDIVHGGQWQIRQSDKTVVTLNLQQNGKSFIGKASFERRKLIKRNTAIKDMYGLVVENGQVDGTLEGDTFRAEIFWDYGETGVYTGKLNAQGRIEGSGYIKQDPNNAARQWTWHSNERMNCASAAPSAPAPTPDKRPVHTVGKGPSSAADPAEATQWDRAVVLKDVTITDVDGKKATLHANEVYPVKNVVGLLVMIDHPVTGKRATVLKANVRLLKPGEPLP